MIRSSRSEKALKERISLLDRPQQGIGLPVCQEVRFPTAKRRSSSLLDIIRFSSSLIRLLPGAEERNGMLPLAQSFV